MMKQMRFRKMIFRVQCLKSMNDYVYKRAVEKSNLGFEIDLVRMKNDLY